MSMKNLGVVFGTFSSITASATETLSFQNAALDAQDRVNYIDLVVTVTGLNTGTAQTSSAFGTEAEFDDFLSVAIGSITWRKNQGSPFASVLPAGPVEIAASATGSWVVPDLSGRTLRAALAAPPQTPSKSLRCAALIWKKPPLISWPRPKPLAKNWRAPPSS